MSKGNHRLRASLCIPILLSLFFSICLSTGSANEGENYTMKIEINKIVYEVKLDRNKTVSDILKNMPLSLSVTRYAGHEYYAALPFTPAFDENRTSKIKAGHVYYWDGWNAFVINYIDWDIAPYKVVHIGKITDSRVSDMLAKANETFLIDVKK